MSSKPAIISLVGLSGSGKTTLSKEMAASMGFDRFPCDDMIEKLLATKLGSDFGGIGGVAQWMGSPWQPDFSERQREYLTAEASVLNEVTTHLRLRKNIRRPVVIDTTGSVVYMSEALKQELRDRSVVIYIRLPEGDLNRAFAQFLEDPKPVVWGEHFKPVAGESNLETLRRNYPEMVKWRDQQYMALAHFSMQWGFLDRETRSTQDFLAELTGRAADISRTSGGR